MKGYKKGAVALIFGVASCGMDASLAEPEVLNYVPLSAVDIQIPTYNQKRLPDGRVQFEINRHDFSSLRYLFSRTVGLYGAGQKPPDDRTCPYINVPDKYITREYQSNGIIRVTMVVDPAIIEAAERQGCVITDTPRP